LILESGTVLFGKLNPRVEKVWRVGSYSTHRKIGSTEWLPIVPCAEVDADFVYYLMWSAHVMPRAKTLISGSTPSRQRVDPKSFYRIEAPLPPLPEQRKIAAVLGLVQRAMEQQERLIEKTAELKNTLLHKLFTEGLRGEPQKQTEIGPIPESWEVHSCEELCQIITVGVVIKPASHYVPKGVPAFRSLNVREDRLDFGDLVFFSQKTNDTVLAKSKLRTGDVLIVRTGYPGTSCVVPPQFDGANCIDIIIARPHGDRVRSGFLSRFFNSPSGKEQSVAAKHGLARVLHSNSPKSKANVWSSI
jgi:type I restriction enzyme S subunit